MLKFCEFMSLNIRKVFGFIFQTIIFAGKKKLARDIIAEHLKLPIFLTAFLCCIENIVYEKLNPLTLKADVVYG